MLSRKMRPIFDKKHYTKSERIFIRVLQEMRIPFKAKVIIAGREVDFIVGSYAIEINGHNQDPLKNEMLVQNGYTPIHIQNLEITKPYLKKIIEKIC